MIPENDLLQCLAFFDCQLDLGSIGVEVWHDSVRFLDATIFERGSRR